MTNSAKTSASKGAKNAAQTAEAAAIDAAQNMREMTETGIERARASYEQFKDSAQETVDLFDGSAAAFKSGSVDLNTKAIEYAQANLNAGFEFARRAVAVKDVSEFFELQSAFAQNQFKSYAEQAQDLGTLSAKVAETSSKPITEGVMKTIDQAKTTFVQV